MRNATERAPLLLDTLYVDIALHCWHFIAEPGLQLREIVDVDVTIHIYTYTIYDVGSLVH